MMMLSTQAPDELFGHGVIGAPFSVHGSVLEDVEDVAAGPWLAVILDGIDLDRLTCWDLPVYLRACDRMEAWAAARKVEAVAELAERSEVRVDRDVAIALREPVGAAQTRIHYATRLRRLLAGTWARFRTGQISEKHAMAVAAATNGVDDPDVLAKVEGEVYAKAGATNKTATELRRDVRRVLARVDPAGAQDRARQARDSADVVLYPGEDGMAAVVVDAPAEQATLIKTAGG